MPRQIELQLVNDGRKIWPVQLDPQRVTIHAFCIAKTHDLAQQRAPVIWGYHAHVNQSHVVISPTMDVDSAYRTLTRLVSEAHMFGFNLICAL